MADIRYKTFNDFSTGMVDKFPSGDSRIPITALTSIVNMDVTEIGTLKKRTGFAKLGSQLTTSGSIQGLHYYGYENQLLSVVNTGLFKYDFDDGTPAWTASGTGLVANYETEFANALTYCWITNAYDVPQRFDGTDMIDSGAGNSPDNNRPLKAAYVQFHQNRLFYGRLREYGGDWHLSRYRFSGLGAIEGADAWPTLDSSFDIEVDDGDMISGLRKYRNHLAVTKNNVLAMLKGTSKIDFGQFIYDTVHGCCANRTMREVDENLLFLNRTGIYTFDSMATKPFSELIKTTFNGLTQSTLTNACGIYFDNKYIVSIPDDDKCLVYNTLSKAWTVYTNIKAEDFAIYTPTDNDIDLYFAGYGTGDRYVYQLFTGNQDDGSDISANFITTKFDCGSPFIKKQFHTVWIYAEGNASDSLTINYRLDYDTAWTPFTSTFDLGNKIQKFSFPAGEGHKGRNIQFQVLNTSSYNFEFKGFTLSYEEVYPA